MGITRASFPTCIRCCSKLRTRSLHPTCPFKAKPARTVKPRYDYDTQDVLEERLQSLQEAAVRLRSYLRAVRHEYEGRAREAVDQYVDAGEDLHTKVQRLYMRVILDGQPVFPAEVEELSTEYYNLISDGGFSEDDIIDYMYGNIHEADDANDADDEGDNTDDYRGNVPDDLSLTVEDDDKNTYVYCDFSPADAAADDAADAAAAQLQHISL